jgi:arsenate reductase (thioredoxin)
VTSTKVVLFVCVENSGRSLMAEAMFNGNPAPGWTARSAGTRPATTANPRTGPMLREIGLELPGHAPQLLTPETMDRARVRVTMGCLDDESCPARLKEIELRDWALPDPAKLDDAGFREVRDRIAVKVKGLRTELVLSDRRAADLPRDHAQ